MNHLQESFDFMAKPDAGSAVRPPFSPQELARLAAEGLYLGTSSWKYRGWEGTIYKGGYSSEAQFQRVSLREYASCFPCVGVDFTYYAWPTPDMMNYLAESTPENFRLCPKVTKRISLASFPELPAYGTWAGKPNPDYLNAELFLSLFVEPLKRLEGRLGVVLLELSGPEPGDLARLDAFFSAVKGALPLAVEIRNPALVTTDFHRRLREWQVSPAFSLWTRMPPLEDQLQAYLSAGGGEDREPLVGLGLLRAGRSYEEAVRLFQPYRELQEPDEKGRRSLAALGDFARSKGRKAFLLATNRWEGSAPHSVGAIAGLLLKN